MITKETLKEIVELQRKELELFGEGIKREKLNDIKFHAGFALILSGVRRSGKSTLLRQIMKKVGSFYYFNFEDPRAVNFEISDFQKLDDIFHELHGEVGYYFFDEIQNVQKWEIFVRKIVDSKKNVVITGSNASLLSRELGTRLTGRHINYEIFPFSYQEFLDLTKENSGIKSFEKYLYSGGFPEYLKTLSNDVLQELLRDIIIRDIATRYKIRNLKVLNEMAVYLLTNVGKEYSYNSLKKIFKLGSINSVISFISYFEDSYLLFSIPKFDYSVKKRIVNPKKIYSIDNGLSSKNSASFSKDFGRMIENLVYIQLRREKRGEIYYFKEEHECDFLIRNGIEIVQAIQVCYILNEDNKERELDGLVKALKKFNLKEGLLLTFNQEDEIEVHNKTIKILPVWKWFIS